MELRLLILSAACVFCLFTSSEGTILLTAAAVKGATLGAGALATKGLLLAKEALVTPPIINALAASAAVRDSQFLKVKSEILRNALQLKARLLAPKHVSTILHPPLPTKPCVIYTVPPPAQPAPIPVTKPVPSLTVAAKISAFLNFMKSVIHAKKNAVSGALSIIKDEIKSPVICGVAKPPCVYYAPPPPPPSVYLPPLQPVFEAPQPQYIEQVDAKKKRSSLK